MEVIAAVVAWTIQIVSRSLPTGIIPIDIYDLQDRLSAGAHIYLPKSEKFSEATTRWSTLDNPTFSLVVEPSVPDDVVEIVKYANEMNLPFLTFNRGHGAITTIGKEQNGIGIWMNQLRSVEIAKDGRTATIGSGALSKDVIDILWAAGKQTVTGVCECTSILGPGLGGGHGLLQGRYGLISDQFISMDVVLADGSSITVDDHENADLWWAMRGAGHNFGVVTSAKLKIFDIEHRDWAYEMFIYTGDKIESLYQGIGEQFPGDDTQSVEVLNLSVFFNNVDIDPSKPVIGFHLLQEGATVVAPQYTARFHDLQAAFTTSGTGSYTDVPAWLGQSNESPSCQRAGFANIRFPTDLEFYNITAQRRAYELFASRIKEFPALNNTSFMFEGYSLQGVKAKPSESSAYPFRMDNLLVSPLLTYLPAGPDLDRAAISLGKDLRKTIYDGSQREELHSYVNYAFGDENKQNWYGYEKWRQDRLSVLKRKYDPKGKFSYYASI